MRILIFLLVTVERSGENFISSHSHLKRRKIPSPVFLRQNLGLLSVINHIVTSLCSHHWTKKCYERYSNRASFSPSGGRCIKKIHFGEGSNRDRVLSMGKEHIFLIEKCITKDCMAASNKHPEREMMWKGF